MREITYHTKPITMGEMVLIQRIQTGSDAEAMVALLVSRTDLAEDEVLRMDVDDATQIMNKVAEAFATATTLQMLGRAL